MKKVLLISPLPPPVGGIATWTKQILDKSKSLVDSGIILHHYNYNLRGRKITSKGILTRIYSGISDLLYHYSSIKKLCESFKPDIVHLTTSGSLGLFKDYVILRFFKSKYVKSILHIRYGRIPEIKEKNNWEWKILKRNLTLSDYIIVLDNGTLKALEEFSSKLALIPNPIVDEKISDLNEVLDKESKSIVFVGHVIKTKGVLELIEAFLELSDEYTLKIIGPYEILMYDELVKVSRNNSRIDFLGSKSNDTVLEELKKCDIFVLPSYTEGFPNVVLEAMAQKCVVISTKVGAIPDMLDGDCGICVDSKSTDALKEAFILLENNKELKDVFVNNAYKKVVEQYSFTKVYNQLLLIWKNL